MKTAKMNVAKLTAGCVLTLIGAMSLESAAIARDRVRTDVGAVYAGGTQGRNPALRVRLEPGLYEIGEIDGMTTKQFLLVDTYSNDEDKVLAIQFSVNALDDEAEVTGTMYLGRNLKEGSVMMLSPLGIDSSGNLRDASEMRTDAAVVEVSMRAGGYRFPYLLKGRNGALGNQLLGMKAARDEKPQLKGQPSSGIFASVSKKKVKLAVSGTEVSIYTGSMADQNYDMIPLNGTQGKFAALTKSTLDTMAGYELGDEQIKKLATFITGCGRNEFMMIANPTAVWGEYRMHFFKKAKRSILEKLFPGTTRELPPSPGYSYMN